MKACVTHSSCKGISYTISILYIAYIENYIKMTFGHKIYNVKHIYLLMNNIQGLFKFRINYFHVKKNMEILFLFQRKF